MNMPPPETSNTGLRAREATPASLVIMITSLVGLGGCQAIKGIFEVGFGVGAIVVIAIVAVVGGAIAMASRK